MGLDRPALGQTRRYRGRLPVKDPTALAQFANDINHALGLGLDPPFAEPRTTKEVDALYTRLGAALDSKKPSKAAPSIGEAITILIRDRIGTTGWTRPWPLLSKTKARSAQSKRAFAELIELVEQGAYDRTKRAERSRVLAQILVIFDLDSLVTTSSADTTMPSDLESRVDLVKRALATRS